MKTDINSPIKQNVRKLLESKSVFSKSWVSDRIFHKPLLWDRIISPARCPSRVHQKSRKSYFINMTVLCASGQREPVCLSSHRCHGGSMQSGTGQSSLAIADYTMLIPHNNGSLKTAEK